jgi:aminoglycoside phosphotransferase (APT) family kinase protein
VNIAAAGLRETPSPYAFDPKALGRWMREHIPGFSGPIEVQQFAAGQSNPTFLVQSPERRYVLRRKPPGQLLPSAHAIDREFRILQALERTTVPVAHPYALCEDESVIGATFYLMDYVEGRIFLDPTLQDVSAPERRGIYQAMIDVLAELHTVDYASVGLAGYGRPARYIERHVARWTQQYRAAETETIDAVERLIEWLPRHIPAAEEATLVHGDFRLDNTIFHPQESRIVAVLDWELSTLGHPVVDLAYFCMRFHLPAGLGGLGEVDARALLLPSEAECVAQYCRRRGCAPIPARDWTYYLAFCMFRLTAILQGVFARALQGNASSATAPEAGRRARPLADLAWRLIRQSPDNTHT